MKKFVAAWSLLCLLLPVVYARSYAGPVSEPVEGASMSGYVVDASTRETLISATVIVKGTGKGAYTNKSGFFSVKNIPAGRHTVRVTFIGYEPKETELTFGESESKTVTFELKPADIQTEAVTVEDDREVEKRQITISKVN